MQLEASNVTNHFRGTIPACVKFVAPLTMSRVVLKPMSATKIKAFVGSIQELPEQERTKAATQLVRILLPDTLESKIESAVLQGRFNGLFAKALEDYANGKALDRIY